jgi:hypothetical protein
LLDGGLARFGRSASPAATFREREPAYAVAGSLKLFSSEGAEEVEYLDSSTKVARKKGEANGEQEAVSKKVEKKVLADFLARREIFRTKVLPKQEKGGSGALFFNE